MTMLNGLVGIVFKFLAIVACTSLSSKQAVLIHQFDDRCRNVQPAMKCMQFIAIRCIALQFVAMRCISLQCIAIRCNALHFVALHCNSLQFIAIRCIALHFVALHAKRAMHCIALRCTRCMQCIALHFVACKACNALHTGRWYHAMQCNEVGGASGVCNEAQGVALDLAARFLSNSFMSCGASACHSWRFPEWG